MPTPKGAQVRVEGLDEFRKALRQLGPSWGRALGKVHRGVSKQVALRARSNAASVGAQQARSAGAIRWSGTAAAARITTTQGGRYPFANPAFWGQIKRTGFYADLWARTRSGRAQALPWVGSDWSVGVKGEGPYAINDAIADEMPRIVGEYGRQLDDLFKQAFPH